MKIGLLLGSFNPPHKGHIELSKTTEVDEVWFVPAQQNPWKKEKPVNIDLRIEMLRACGLIVCDIEKKMGEGPHKTYDVIMSLKKEYPENTYSIICGEDIDVSKWYRGEDLLKEVEIIKYPRSFGLSSSLIREKILKGLSIDEDIPIEILKIIQNNKLYSL